MTRLLHWTLPALLALALLAGCRREPEAQAPAEPAAAVTALAQALRDNDLVRFQKLSLPPAQYAQRAALWDRQLARATPVSAEQAERYRQWMAELTAPEAEAALLAKAEPRLQAFEAEMGPRWELSVRMLATFAKGVVSANATLSEAEQAHLHGVVDATSAWALARRDFTDRAKIKAAIGIAADTARRLQLPTLEASRALAMEPLLVKAGTVLAAGKAVLALYEVDANAVLASVQAETVKLEGDLATVTVRYTLFGQPVTFEQTMRRVGEGWYREEALQELQRALAEEAAAEAAGPAPAVTDRAAPPAPVPAP
jgi:hypothetical protein